MKSHHLFLFFALACSVARIAQCKSFSNECGNNCCDEDVTGGKYVVFCDENHNILNRIFVAKDEYKVSGVKNFDVYYRQIDAEDSCCPTEQIRAYSRIGKEVFKFTGKANVLNIAKSGNIVLLEEKNKCGEEVSVYVLKQKRFTFPCYVGPEKSDEKETFISENEQFVLAVWDSKRNRIATMLDLKSGKFLLENEKISNDGWLPAKPALLSNDGKSLNVGTKIVPLVKLAPGNVSTSIQRAVLDKGDAEKIAEEYAREQMNMSLKKYSVTGVYFSEKQNEWNVSFNLSQELPYPGSDFTVQIKADTGDIRIFWGY